MIRVLRPRQTAELVSARVFDELFARNLEAELDIQQVDFLPWCNAILGPSGSPYPLREAARNFAAEAGDFEFFCPGYHCISLAPLFLSLRNQARARTRLLLIAHAPGAYVLEWALLRPLMRPGDLIIAPSASAASLIDFLCPELGTFVRVVPHPMHRLPGDGGGERERIISLGRISRGKLLHRQIEAMEVLRDRGYGSLRMQIAGPLHDGSSSEPTTYARALAAKIRRLRLGDHVELVGQINGDSDKAAFISGARLMLNLSVTIEESFGKSVVEALGLGVPVVATHWNGLPETVGPGGSLLRVSEVGPGMDVTAEQIADAIERAMTEPPLPETCREQANRFHPERVRRTYHTVLEEGLEVSAHRHDVANPIDDGAAPARGLLSRTAPLMHFSWRELFDFHTEDCARIRRHLTGETVSGRSNADRLRTLMWAGTRSPVERFLGGLDYAPSTTTGGSNLQRTSPATDFIGRVVSASTSQATPSSRLACLAELCNANLTPLLKESLAAMKEEGLRPSSLDYFAAEAERRDGNFAEAFRLCTATEDPSRSWGEFSAHRLRQLARICREWDKPELALPRLRHWLERFPDSPDSGPVWLDRCVNASRAGKGLKYVNGSRDWLGLLTEAREAFDRAQSLLGNSPLLDKVEADLEP